MDFKKHLINTFGINEPIYIEDINYADFSRSRCQEELEKLVNNGELKRFDDGVYYFSEKTPWGTDSMIDSERVIQRRFISHNNDIYGYKTGFTLWNESGLSTQVPNFIEIATNNESELIRNIKIGCQRVRTRKPRTKITKENVYTLQFLDLMTVMQPMRETSNFEHYALMSYIERVKKVGVTRDTISQHIGLFPIEAMKNLIESGAIYEFA
jgi:hypothetical protein